MLSDTVLFVTEKELSIKINRHDQAAGWCISIEYGLETNSTKTSLHFNSKKESDTFLSALAVVCLRAQALEPVAKTLKTVVELMNKSKKEES
jgi:hypothetical protein